MRDESLMAGTKRQKRNARIAQVLSLQNKGAFAPEVEIQ